MLVQEDYLPALLLFDYGLDRRPDARVESYDLGGDDRMFTFGRGDRSTSIIVKMDLGEMDP